MLAAALSGQDHRQGEFEFAFAFDKEPTWLEPTHDDSFQCPNVEDSNNEENPSTGNNFDAQVDPCSTLTYDCYCFVLVCIICVVIIFEVCFSQNDFVFHKLKLKHAKLFFFFLIFKKK